MKSCQQQEILQLFTAMTHRAFDCGIKLMQNDCVMAWLGNTNSTFGFKYISNPK